MASWYSAIAASKSLRPASAFPLSTCASTFFGSSAIAFSARARASSNRRATISMRAGLALRVRVLGQQIGGADVLAHRIFRIVHAHVRVGELHPHIPELGIGLDRRTELDDRLLIVGVVRVRGAAFDVLGGRRLATAGADERNGADEDDRGAARHAHG